MSSNRFRSLLICSALLLSIHPDLYASSATATLTGTVDDSSGAAVAAAAINLHQRAGSAVLTTRSDASGEFSFTDVTPGEYLLDASARDLSLQKPQSLILSPGKTTKVSLRLVISALKAQVSVTAADAPQSVDQISKQLDVVNTSEAERRGLLSV